MSTIATKGVTRSGLKRLNRTHPPSVNTIAMRVTRKRPSTMDSMTRMPNTIRAIHAAIAIEPTPIAIQTPTAGGQLAGRGPASPEHGVCVIVLAVLCASGCSRRTIAIRGERQTQQRLPVRRLVVFQKLAPDVRARVEAGNDRINDPRGTIDDVERWMKAVVRGLARGDLCRIFVGNPAGVHAVHVDAVVEVVGR